jgi:hypothetical protein
MVMDPAPVHVDMGEQIRHRLACGEWVRMGEPMDLHENVPGAGVMLLEESTPLLLELLVTVSGNDMHNAVPIGDRGFQLR